MISERIKWLALYLAFATSLPGRKREAARRAAKGSAPLIVLFYHRVADLHPNDWTISNSLFEKEIDWIGKHFDFVSLEEGQHRLRQGNPRAAVSITFDDGYSENCDHALPLLLDRNIPVTYFVANQFIEQGAPFPHDVERGCPLAPNSPEQLRQMADAGVEMGAHTRSHADLGKIDDGDQLFDEVIRAAQELEQLVDRPVRYFAFPYGMHANLNRNVFQMVHEAGFLGACSAYGGYNFPGDDPFHLQRIHGDADMLRLRNWLSVDPRKIRITPRFDLSLLSEESLAISPLVSSELY